MATVSFKEDVFIRDPKKAKELARAFKQPRDRTIRPSLPDELPKNAGAIWFSVSQPK